MYKMSQVPKALMSVLALIWLILACGGPSPSRATPENKVLVPAEAGLTALLTQVEGSNVIVVESTDAGEQSTRLALPGQMLSSGTRIRVPAGVEILLVCSSDHVVKLAGEVDWQLTEAACDQGTELPPGTFRTHAPKGGRTLSDEDRAILIEYLSHAPGR